MRKMSSIGYARRQGRPPVGAAHPKQGGVHSKKGITLVEIMMAFVAMLLLVSIISGAMGFSVRAIEKSRRINENVAAAATQLRQKPPLASTLEDTKLYQFTVVGGSGTNVLFEVKLDRISREIALLDGEKTTFYQFRPIVPLPEGGG